MKFLNKIVFINSARIPYGEVNLDGNVHFTGTQGVGKSTMLRAILFFYNADKTKLGISKEKKSFDEYYFPQANSYIVYEVKLEHGAYCVLAFKSSGRVCFRFIDSEYRREAFINERGEAYSNWPDINKALGDDVHHSNIIDRYELYRDIVYGNLKAVKPSLKKYALLHSASYQNIPRTIHNVFLNTKLDAEFIKQTIIQSMEEEELVIDLEKHKHQIESINAQLRDLQVWRETDRQGNSLMMALAGKVVEEWRALKALEVQRRKLAEEMNWAYRKAQEGQPQLLDELAKTQAERVKLEEKSRALWKKFDALRQKYSNAASNAKKDMELAERYRKEYEAKGIAGLEKQQARKPELELQLASLRSQSETLKSQAADLAAKYARLIDQKNLEIDRFEGEKQQQRNRLEREAMERETKLRKLYDKLVDEIRQQREEEMAGARQQVDAAVVNIHALEVQKVKIGSERPFGDELERLNQNLAKLSEENILAQTQSEMSRREVDSLRREWEIAVERLENAGKSQQEELVRQSDRLKSEIATIDTLLANRKGSLYAWLEQELPGWEKSIGKVIDEERVLYNPNLSPRKVAESGALFGIEIDLSELPDKVKSLTDWENERAQLESRLQVLEHQSHAQQKQLEEEKEKLQNRYTPKIREQKELIKKKDYQFEQNQQRIREMQLESHELTRKGEEQRQLKLDAIDEKINAAILKKQEAEGAETGLKKRFVNLEDAKRSEQRQEEKALRLELDAAKEQLTDETNRYKLARQTEIEVLKREECEALQAEGVDTTRLLRIEKEHSDVEHVLRTIEQNRSLLEQYRTYKRDWIDRFAEFKTQQQEAIRKRESEEHRYETEKATLKIKCDELDEQIKRESAVISALEHNLSEVEKFRLTPNYDLVREHVNERHTEYECTELINRLQGNFLSESNGMNRLTEQSRRLTQRLSPENRFGFMTNPVSRTDLFNLAEHLADFIEENKLDTFEKELQEQFGMVIQTYAGEINTLMAKEGEVQRVINDINRDFTVNGGFTTVIKKIELRRVESQSRIIQQLQRIHRFANEESIQLGERNLFNAGQMDSANAEAVKLLVGLSTEIDKMKDKYVSLSDAFELQFQIIENDNDSGWVERLANVGSDGTDVLVKAMINIMLLNVFKQKASRKSGEFKLHCMMDEIGKLHPNNVKGILDFANKRNILLINSSPISQRATDYGYTYQLRKDEQSRTRVTRLIRMVTK